MLELTWYEQLERLEASKANLDNALEEMRLLEQTGELRLALESAAACIEGMAERTHRRIEILDSKEESALEREYYRSVI